LDVVGRVFQVRLWSHAFKRDWIASAVKVSTMGGVTCGAGMLRTMFFST
jgi:hypothetical protein